MGIDLHSSWRQVQKLGLTESNLGQFEHNSPGTEATEDKCPWGKKNLLNFLIFNFGECILICSIYKRILDNFMKYFIFFSGVFTYVKKIKYAS